MNDKKQNLVDRYIRGELTDEEKTLFEKQLAEDEELREMFRYTKKVYEAIRDRNEKLEKINQWKSENSSSEKSLKFHQTLTGKIVYLSLSIAAVIAIFFYLNRFPSMPDLDVQRYECYRCYNGVSHVAQLIKEKNMTMPST